MNEVRPQGRPANVLPDPPYPVTKPIRLKVVQDMVEYVCDAVIEELKNNEELYKIIDTYIDSGDYDITEKDRARLKRNYRNVIAPVIHAAEKAKERVKGLKFTGGRPTK